MSDRHHPPDAVVFQPAKIKVALVLAHRGQGGMIDPGRIPVGLQHVAGIGEFEDAAVVETRGQPFVDRHLLGHAQPEAGLAHRKVESRRADAHQGNPIVTIRRPVDVVHEPGEMLDQKLELTLPRPFDPVAKHLAQRRTRN
jgi:hypothetical protein